MSSGGKKLSAYLRRNDVTYEQFGDAVGCSRSMIGHLCSGDKKPGRELANKIDKATNGQVDPRSWDR